MWWPKYCLLCRRKVDDEGLLREGNYESGEGRYRKIEVYVWLKEVMKKR